VAEIHPSVVALVTQQLGINTGAIADQAWQGRTGKLSPSAPAAINLLRDDPGRASVKSLREEMTKLDFIRRLELPPDFFDHTATQELERYRQRIAVEASFELRRHPEPLRLTWLAAFAYVRAA
jgi:hypothetical protein